MSKGIKKGAPKKKKRGGVRILQFNLNKKINRSKIN